MTKYNIVYADPPWSYDNKRTGGSMTSGAENQYPTLTTEDICNLPINNIVDKNCVLFLWATVPLLLDAFQVMVAWGFKYKTMLTWRKDMNGLGFWFRGQTEHLLFGVKGKVKAFRCQEPNFLSSKPLKHSEKPKEFRQLIESATNQMENPKRIELFARNRVDGWDALGNDLDGQDIKTSLINLGNVSS